MKLLFPFIALLFSSHLFAAEKKHNCHFPTKAGLTQIEKCAVQFKDGEFKISKSSLKTIEFDSNGLAGGRIGKAGCFWINKKGTALRTHCFDNGADYFQDGLARYVDKKGRFGFLNEKLQIKIPAKYSFAFPFEYGFAKVCMNCAPKKLKDSEHDIINGGEWSVIDKTGKVVKKCKDATREHQCSPPNG